MKPNVKRLKWACWTCNLTMSATTNLSPVLFLTFRFLYGFSYSMMGLLVLINFASQLIIDLLFSFFSHRMNLAKTVKSIPLLASFGFFLYGTWPLIFPQYAFWGILTGTVIFSAAAGFAEVLISPVIAALPSKHPDREVSALHSVYAWGVVGVVILSAVYLLIAGGENWFFLPLLFLILPLSSSALFLGTAIPPMETPQKASGALSLLNNRGIILGVIAIFLGGATECTMGQWCSGYLEGSLQIPKLWGDLFGTALFSLFLGLGRSLYAKKGKKIHKILVLGSLGCVICYVVAALSPFPLLGLCACALTGFCASMLWPGNLIATTTRYPQGGVFIFALMAAGGDLGASIGPQLTGIVTDLALTLPRISELASSLTLSPEQLGMKLGMLSGALFPLTALAVYHFIGKSDEKI